MNKSSKLVIVLTAVYWLITIFITSNLYGILPFYLSETVFYVFFLGSMATATILGIITTIKMIKMKSKGRWFMLLLTLFNIAIFIFTIKYFITIKFYE